MTPPRNRRKMSKKQPTVIKILGFCLLFACLLTALVGCGKPDETEFLATAKDLLARSEQVNALCFGEGLSPNEDGYTVGKYAEATEESLSAFDVASVTEIKEKIHAVYSVATAEWIESVVFSAIREDNSVLSYSRYYDTVAAEEDGSRAVLMVKKDHEPLINGRASYGNVRILSLSSRRAEILVDVTVEKDGESRVEKDVSLSLRAEEDGWRLDSPSYVTFD